MKHSFQVICVFVAAFAVVFTAIAALTPGWLSGKLRGGQNYGDSLEIGDDPDTVIDISDGLLYSHVSVQADGIYRSVTILNPNLSWYTVVAFLILLKAVIWQIVATVMSRQSLSFSRYDNTMLAHSNMRRAAIFQGIAAVNILVGMLMITVPFVLVQQLYSDDDSTIGAVLSIVKFSYSFYFGWVALAFSITSSILCGIAASNISTGGSNIHHVPMI